jgi:cellulose synthase/poly-beta-1,6-N-acetylglucosamine synthase-like glycosyltransferase/peptidoglycan/xylan/chitin deacetylase (PgdA/CDA1 family)
MALHSTPPPPIGEGSPPARGPAPPVPPRVAGHHWGRRLLLGFCLGMLVILLLVDGFTTKTVGASGTGGCARPQPSSHCAGSPLASQNPVLVANGRGGLVSHQPAPGRRIAFTFDDGPSPEWTAKIASILLAQHVPATFFEVGSQVVRYPGLTRMLHRDGFELGNHTFTHASLAALPGWEAHLQISLTESAISGITGVRPRLVRPPYSSSTEAVTPNEERAWGAIAAHGYTIALANYDTEDWNRPGVSAIVDNVLNEPNIRRGVGGIILMHDAGGNRAETVAALPKLIAALRARHFAFATVSQLAGIPHTAAEVPASSGQRLRGGAFDAMLALAGFVTNFLTRVVLLVTVLVGLRMLVGLILAHVQRRRERAYRWVESVGFAPPVSILVPAHDEEVGIERAVRSLAGARYDGPLEVIVVDDGSTDATAAIVQRLDLERVRLIRQRNAGKAAALNRALSASRHEIIVTVDADTVFEPDTLALLVQRFREPDVGAISGNTKVGNRHGLIGRWQHIEYVMGFNLDRRMYEVLGCTPTVPGAIGAFRRQALADIGGVSGATLAEDTDITLDIGRFGWRVVYEARARAWTEAPSTLRALYRQRSRWAYGTIQSMWKHRNAIWSRPPALPRRGAPGGGPNARNRRVGSRGARAVLTLALFQLILPLTAPLIDLFAIYSILFQDPMPILAYWLAFNLFQLTLAWVAFGFDNEPRRDLWALPLQQFCHRQVSYLVVYDGVISALLGSHLRWHRIERTGEVGLVAGEVGLAGGEVFAREEAGLAEGEDGLAGEVGLAGGGVPAREEAGLAGRDAELVAVQSGGEASRA